MQQENSYWHCFRAAVAAEPQLNTEAHGVASSLSLTLKLEWCCLVCKSNYSLPALASREHLFQVQHSMAEDRGMQWNIMLRAESEPFLFVPEYMHAHNISKGFKCVCVFQCLFQCVRQQLAQITADSRKMWGLQTSPALIWSGTDAREDI